MSIQVEYLLGEVERLAANASSERGRWRMSAKAAGERMGGMDEKLGTTDRDVKTICEALIGPNGQALVEAYTGLALTALGVALTVAGLQFSW